MAIACCKVDLTVDGGCAIFWRCNLNATATPLSTNSRRVCAVRICNDKLKLLLVNAYMPCESDESSSIEFCSQLSVIQSLIEDNADCQSIVGGDFNVDFSRNWTHTDFLNTFCFNNGLNPIVRHKSNSIDYTYNFSMKRFNTLDHFLLPGFLFDTAVESAEVLHCVDNTSDHDPVILKLSIDIEQVACSVKVHASKIAWYKADACHIAKYKEILNGNLLHIRLPVDALLCQDVLCCNTDHITALDCYSQAITEACLNAANCAIPHTHNSGCKQTIPGWSEFVEPVREKSLFWHKIWIDCGRPKTGVVAGIMRKTRLAYHYAIRKVKRMEKEIISERFAEAIIDNKSRDFWFEVKRMRGKSATASNVVDGLTTPESIAAHFAEKYQDLYTSVAYNDGEMSAIVNELNSLIAETAFDSNSAITCNDVMSAINKLKSNKNDGNKGLSSDHLKVGSNELSVHISLLLTGILVHGCVPDDMAVSTVIPIPKGRNANFADSANYRGISLSSMFGKIFDLIVINRYSASLFTSDLQFGFKLKRSTNICSLILKECISYYNVNNSTVYCTMLDATKAFDRVEYCKLFRQLMSRNLPPIVIRLLLNMYINHSTRVSWKLEWYFF